MDTWIPLNDCVDGRLYAIDARNATIGIFNAESRSFLISRFKFGSNFLFEEEHWDCGEPHGTAKPLRDLGSTPYEKWKWDAVASVGVRDYLNQRGKELCPDS